MKMIIGASRVLGTYDFFFFTAYRLTRAARVHSQRWHDIVVVMNPNL